MDLIEKHGLVGNEKDIYKMYNYIKIKKREELIKCNIESGKWKISKHDYEADAWEEYCDVCDLMLRTRQHVILKCGHIYCTHCVPESMGDEEYLCKEEH